MLPDIAADKEKLKQEIRTMMDTYLAGSENSQKTFLI